MTENIFKIFLNGIKDTKGLYHLIDQLKNISKALYHNQSGTITQKLQGSLLPSIESIFRFLEQNGLEPEGDEAQKKFIDEIIQYLKKVPQAKITLAFEPTDIFLNKLNDQFSTLIGQKVILDIVEDQKIIGGLTIEYKGKYKDYSVGPRVENYLKEQITKFKGTEKT